MSPEPARSTLMTFAPMSARSCVANGPCKRWLKSRMVTPARALGVCTSWFKKTLRNCRAVGWAKRSMPTRYTPFVTSREAAWARFALPTLRRPSHQVRHVAWRGGEAAVDAEVDAGREAGGVAGEGG